jgi:hypothetical protein
LIVLNSLQDEGAGLKKQTNNFIDKILILNNGTKIERSGC